MCIGFCCFTAFLVLGFIGPIVAEGAVIDFIPEFDATLRDDGFDGTFDSGGNANSVNGIRRTDGVVNEIFFFEYDLSTLDDTANIASAQLSFEVFGIPNAPGDIEVLVYQADGILTFPDDGSRPAQSVASYDPITEGGGVVSIALDATVVNGFVSSGDFIGIRMQGLETNASTNIFGVNGFGSQIPPTLSLDITAVPEPSASVFLMAMMVPVIAVRRRYLMSKRSDGQKSV
jgi:hypothetical protein